MAKIAALSSLIAVGLLTGGNAAACEFHGMGFGPPGSGWGSYYSSTHHYSASDELTGWGDEETEAAQRQAEADLFQRAPAPRPTFSNAATRAADTAKDRARLTKFQRRIGMRVVETLMRKQASNMYR